MKWAALAAATTALFSATAEAQTLKVVMHSDVKIVDPIWTTAYIVRNYGYMVYDTLLAVDDKLDVKPQMLESWKVSDDKLTYTFTLRDGLKFHDGAPVKAEDCIASIKRWASRDAMGQKLMSFTKDLAAVDDKTFTLALKEPYGLVIESLGKPSSNVPFIMPKRIAETPGNTQIKEFIGSGPFVFRADLWRPGEKTVYDKFKDYKPR
ncbi:ABC transporter substrate-binding protein, partial [Reyranella sp.]